MAGAAGFIALDPGAANLTAPALGQGAPGPALWRSVALAVNGTLLAAGAWLVVRPSFAADAWTGRALFVMSALNAAAILLPSRSREQARARARLRRIMRLANALLLALGLLFAAAAVGHGLVTALEGTALTALVGAPLLNALAIPRSRGHVASPAATSTRFRPSRLAS